MRRKGEAMRMAYGHAGDKKCKNCINLLTYDYKGKRYRKCKAYGVSHSNATDWRVTETACGLFNKTFDDMGLFPLLETLRGMRGESEAEIIAGQMGIEEIGGIP